MRLIPYAQTLVWSQLKPGVAMKFSNSTSETSETVLAALDEAEAGTLFEFFQVVEGQRVVLATLTLDERRVFTFRRKANDIDPSLPLGIYYFEDFAASSCNGATLVEISSDDLLADGLGI